MEGECGVKVHNLHDFGSNSSCTCLTEPDCELAVHDGLFNGEYQPGSDTMSDVGVIDIKRNVAIERKADRGFGENVTDALTFNGITIDCLCRCSCRLASLSVVTGPNEPRSCNG